MNDNDVLILIYSILTLGGLGLVSSVILYFVAQKFKVYEDPLVNEINETLPQANCGGCGYAGCNNFAEACVKSANEHKSISGFFCPVGGNDLMKQVAEILSFTVEDQKPMIAVVRCNGSHTNVPAKSHYEGISKCLFANNLFAGEGACPNGCLGLGDCVVSCAFDAITINTETGLPEVTDACVACGACVKACPRAIIELRPKGPKGKRIYVSCVNTEKGAVAAKNCSVSCIGCQKCFKECPHGAIEMKNNLAYIDGEKCKLCRKCVEVCPKASILEINFAPRKPKVTTVENNC
ncbi:MAG: RnfABCDGE type electron transport complex subunit B [Lentimicrobiaceae bacterium]|nr:RnfABCDGE type electron transport complex subunit B [Lentimicrobiaceae bacterium]